KTGTAQIQDPHNKVIAHTTWFASYAPYDKPRWAVVVMVEDGISGGATCSPVGGKVFKALMEREQRLQSRPGSLAQIHP
ncbi:MAG TPA: penicillin-binding transpeptidase domain-containing protein, partial [Terriglobales bacterium]|nr:penicillin-binding transpeptidase domain-containing protein [Terriglobales bacterium]